MSKMTMEQLAEIKLSNAQIAWRAAQDIEDGAYVNLGIGFPEMVAKFQPSIFPMQWSKISNGDLFSDALATEHGWSPNCDMLSIPKKADRW